MPSFVQDVAYAARVLRKSPGFTAIALFTLAVGIGANTAVFSVFHTVLLRPLPYPDSKQVVMIWEKRPHEANSNRVTVSAMDFIDWRRTAQNLSSMAMYSPGRFSLTGEGEPERVPGCRVTAGFFESLGIPPQMGRTFSIGEEQPGHERVAVLSYGLWQRRLAGDPAVLGKTISVNGAPFEIVGVMPRNFRFAFASDSQIWIPVRLGPEDLRYRGIHQYYALGRVKNGTGLDQARAEMDSIAAQLERQHPDSNTGHGTSLLPLADEVAWKLKPALQVLLGAAFLVLLITCANVANLLLARAESRRREAAVRAAMGASRLRLIRQSLAESALLALGGAAAGVALAAFGLDALRTAFFSRLDFFSVAGLDTVRLDWRMLAFTLVSAVACTLLFGVSPALATGGVRLQDVLKSGGRGASSSRARFRDALIVGELALSLFLLTGAGLLAKSFVNMLHVDLGFRTEQTLTAGISLPRVRYQTTEQAGAFWDALLDQVRTLPSVRSAGVTDTLPLSGDDNRMGIAVPGRVPVPGERLRVHPRLVSTSYLHTMGIRIVQGRDFTPADASGKPLVAIVSETAARRFWPDGIAAGRTFAFATDHPDPIQVIGVAAAVHNSAPDQQSTEDAYLPYRENPFLYLPTNATLVVRADSQDGSLPAAIRATVTKMDRSLPVSDIRWMDSYLADSVAPRRFNLSLLAIFAAVALVLAAAGLYGVIAYLVGRRTSEIGIRMALGARPGQVLRLVIGRGMLLAVVGAALGLAGSLAAAPVLGSLLYGVGPRDSLVFGVAPLVLLVVAAVASYAPARRAAALDPMRALREE